MTKKLLFSVTGTAAVAAAAVWMMVPPPPATPMENAPTLNPAPAAHGPDGSAEGIDVHGYWVIEVHNPDGGLVTRHEFENALVAEGRESLRDVLTGFWQFGDWTVLLWTGTDFVCSTTSNSCIITQNEFLTGDAVFKNLTVTANFDGSLTLSGSATAVAEGSVTQVQTRIPVCSTGGFRCLDLHVGKLFTQTDLTPPLGPVLAGQSILVTVTISFT